MRRRDFLKSSVALAMAAELGTGRAAAFVPAHNWANYDFGSGPPVTDRLNQGPFPQYPPDAVIPNDDVVMTTTPSEEVVPNYGKGLITYITADMGTDEIKSDNVAAGDRGAGRVPAWAAALYTADVAGSAAAARTPGVARLPEACFRPGQEKQQAGRLARSDERSGLHARSRAAGFRAGQSAESRSGAQR